MTQPSRDWPALMDLETAGAYLSLSPGALASLLRREQVAPFVFGARLRRWSRQDLDALVARFRPAEPREIETACGDSADGLDSALAAVERRAADLTRSRKRHEVRPSHPAV